MLPTLNVKNDVVFLEKITPRLKKLQVGDVVIAHPPTSAEKTVCKRIIGLEGAVVTVKPRRWHQEERKIKVPPGHVWLEGDNPKNSIDSRSYGPVPIVMVKGRVLFKIWPSLTRMRRERPPEEVAAPIMPRVVGRRRTRALKHKRRKREREEEKQSKTAPSGETPVVINGPAEVDAAKGREGGDQELVKHTADVQVNDRDGDVLGGTAIEVHVVKEKEEEEGGEGQVERVQSKESVENLVDDQASEEGAPEEY
ncbi:unnamed protein product [Chrysoparadoxa australica]